MALATTAPGGRLQTLNDRCKITIEGVEINLKILPELSDSKGATYADERIIGRSSPIKTYSHSENRVISLKLHFLAVEQEDLAINRDNYYLLASATYPRDGTPYRPPPIATIQCGELLGREPLCCVLYNYSLNIPTNVVWDPETLIPYYFQVSTSWHVVYATSGSNALPNQERIMVDGR